MELNNGTQIYVYISTSDSGRDIAGGPGYTYFGGYRIKSLLRLNLNS